MPKARMRPQATRLSFWPGLSLFTRPPLQQCHFLGLPPTSSHLCSTLLLPPFPKHHTPDVLKTMLHECALAVHESLPAPALVGMSDSVAATQKKRFPARGRFVASDIFNVAKHLNVEEALTASLG